MWHAELGLAVWPHHLLQPLSVDHVDHSIANMIILIQQAVELRYD